MIRPDETSAEITRGGETKKCVSAFINSTALLNTKHLRNKKEEATPRKSPPVLLSQSGGPQFSAVGHAQESSESLPEKGKNDLKMIHLPFLQMTLLSRWGGW